MESAIGISIVGFGIEFLTFTATGGLMLFLGTEKRLSDVAFRILFAITIISGFVGFLFPLVVFLENPGGIFNWSPISIAVLVGGPAMPLALWILRRKRVGK